MAQPTPYDRITNFQDQQATAPTAPYPAPDFDAEYNAIKITTDEIINNLGLIQRSDGQLKNGIVTSDSLSPELALGFDAPSPWETGVQYIEDISSVFEGTAFYLCQITHVSTVFADDLAAGKWAMLADFADVAGDAAESAAEAAASAVAAAGSAAASAASAGDAGNSALQASDHADSAEAAAQSALKAVEAVAFRWVFSDTLTMADPGAGGVRFNNATPSLITLGAISALAGDTGNPNVRDFLKSWDDSTTPTHRGCLVMRSANAPQNYIVFALTGAVVDNVSWVQLPLAYVGHHGTLVNADTLVTQFIRTGDRGAQGASGAGTGDMVAANNLSDVQSKPTSRTNLQVPYIGGDTLTGAWTFSGTIKMGPNAAISNAPFASRQANGNDIEFGHPSPDVTKYLGVLGHDVGTGAPFLALGAEAGTTPSKFRTRGLKGRVLRNVGGYLQSVRVPLATADDQDGIVDFHIDDSGNAHFPDGTIPTAPTAAKTVSTQQLATTAFVHSLTDLANVKTIRPEDFPGVVGDGVNNDTAGWISCMNAANAQAPCVVLGKPGATYIIDALALRYTANDVTVDLRGATVKAIGAVNIPGIVCMNAGVSNNFADVTADAAIGAMQITLSSVTPTHDEHDPLMGPAPEPRAVGPLAVGDYISITDFVIPADPGATAMSMIAKVMGISGFVVTLDLPLPFPILASRTQQVRRVNANLRNVFRNATIDTRSSTGTAVRAVTCFYQVGATIENVRVLGLDNCAGYLIQENRDCTFQNFYSEGAGGGVIGASGEAHDIAFQQLTRCHIENIRSYESASFGPCIATSCYLYMADLGSYLSKYRGMKLQAVVASVLDGGFCIGAGTTGFMLCRGTSRNVISNIVSLKSTTWSGSVAGEGQGFVMASEGVSPCQDNVISNVVSMGHATYDFVENTLCTGNLYNNFKVGDLSKIAMEGGGVINGLAGANGANVHAIGAYVTSNVNAPTVALPNSSAQNITSITLRAGDWDVTGHIALQVATSTTMTAFLGGIHTATAAFPASLSDPGYVRLQQGFIAALPQSFVIGRKRIVVPVGTTQTIYLNAQTNWSGGTGITGYGSISARRVG